MRLREHEAIQDGKLDMFRADPRKLTTIDGYNVRDLTTPDAVAKLDELADSITEVGVLDPLVVRFDGERIIVVEGHRRLAATLMAIDRGAEIKSVPIYQEARSVNDAQRDLGLIISNSGEPLTPLEKAKVVGRLVAHGWSTAEIAKRCGWKSVGSVNQYLDMLAMPEAVKEQVRNNDVSATTALKVVRDAKTDPAFASELIASMKAENQRNGVGKRHKTSSKVTPRNLKRDKQNEKPKSDSANGADHSAPSASTVEVETVAPEIAEQLPVVSENGNGVAGIDAGGGDGDVGDAEAVDFPAAVQGGYTAPSGDGIAPPLPRTGIGVMPCASLNARLVLAAAPKLLSVAIETLAIFAKHAEDNCVSERPDDYVVEIPAGDLKRAWRDYQAVAGDAQ